MRERTSSDIADVLISFVVQTFLTLDLSRPQVVYGRTIHYKVSGYLKGLAWRYKATATDKATGTIINQTVPQWFAKDN